MQKKFKKKEKLWKRRKIRKVRSILKNKNIQNEMGKRMKKRKEI